MVRRSGLDRRAAQFIPALSVNRHEVDSGSYVQIRNLPQDVEYLGNPKQMHPACITLV